MSTFKGLLAITIFTALCVYGALLLDVGAHHRDPLWALGFAVGFIVMLITDVWLFFAVAKDDPFKWE
jgi:hypothetical protein